jgi:hypothetical protein
MANSRRDFIKKSAMAVVAAGIPIELSEVVFARSGNGAAGFAVPVESLNDPLMYLKRSSFEPYANSIFRVRTSHYSANLNLIQISSGYQHSQAFKAKKASTTVVRESEERFALLFKSTDSIPQEVYNLDHAALGKFRMLIVPVVNRDRRAYYYEAVINRIR